VKTNTSNRRPLLTRRGIHFVATRFGWAKLRSAAFDAMAMCRAWGGQPESTELVEIVEQHISGKWLHLHGCGTADILRQLNFDQCSGLFAVDASPYALGVAKLIAPSTLPCVFVAGDMRHTELLPTGCHLFAESLYYIPLKEQIAMLRRLRGSAVITVAQPERFDHMLSGLRDAFGSSVTTDRRFKNSSRHLMIISLS
jgi:hypothetical protein